MVRKVLNIPKTTWYTTRICPCVQGVPKYLKHTRDIQTTTLSMCSGCPKILKTPETFKPLHCPCVQGVPKSWTLAPKTSCPCVQDIPGTPRISWHPQDIPGTPRISWHTYNHKDSQCKYRWGPGTVQDSGTSLDTISVHHSGCIATRRSRNCPRL